MSLLNHYRKYPQLSLCSALLLLLGCLSLGAYVYTTQKNKETAIERYGQLLATSTAHQAVDATLIQDMVSLQAILQEVAQHPNVVGATLHNVNNQLMVQSGYKPNQSAHGKRYNFTAPVALHNNVTGYLEVTLEEPRFSIYDFLFFIVWIFAVASSLFIIWWSIQRHWWSNFRDKLPSANAVISAAIEKLPGLPTIAKATLEPEPQENKPITQVSVRLSLHIINLNKLYQQLNSEGFDIVLRRFEKQLNIVLRLYNNQRHLLVGDKLLIDFTGEETYECTFRAICCAQILMNTVARNPSPRLQLAALIQPLTPNLHTSGCALQQEFIVQHNNPLTATKNDILINAQLLDAALLQHVEFDVASGKLLSIKAPYSDYINQQEEQLQLA